MSVSVAKQKLTKKYTFALQRATSLKFPTCNLFKHKQHWTSQKWKKSMHSSSVSKCFKLLLKINPHLPHFAFFHCLFCISGHYYCVFFCWTLALTGEQLQGWFLATLSQRRNIERKYQTEKFTEKQEIQRNLLLF